MNLPLINHNYWTKFKENTITIKLNNLLHTRQFSLDGEYCIATSKTGTYQAYIFIICQEYEKNNLRNTDKYLWGNVITK